MTTTVLFLALMQCSTLHEGIFTSSQSNVQTSQVDQPAHSEVPPVEPVHQSSPLAQTDNTTFRFIISGNLGGFKTGYEGFYHSPLFRSSGSLPITIEDANVSVWKSPSGIFFSNQLHASVEELVSLANHSPLESNQFESIWGPNAIGFHYEKSEESSSSRRDILDQLRRTLAGVQHTVLVEKKQINGRTYFGVRFDHDSTLQWPTQVSSLTSTPGALGQYKAANNGLQSVLFLGRSQSSTARAFGLIDELMSAPNQPPTLYIDAGNALLGKEHTAAQHAFDFQKIVLDRKPNILNMGFSEQHLALADSKFVRMGPYVSSARLPQIKAGHSNPPLVRRVSLGQTSILFAAIGREDPFTTRAWSASEESAVLNRTLKAVRAEQRREPAALIVALASDATGKELALSSGTFDAVVYLSSKETLALPGKDIINLTNNHDSRLHATPGLVRVSSSDISEVVFSLDRAGQLEELEISRHPIVDTGNTAVDVHQVMKTYHDAFAGEQPLPARALLGGERRYWSKDELSRLRGQWVREAMSTEVSIVASISDVAPVAGPVPRPLVLAWLEDDDKIFRLSLSGHQAKQILKAFSSADDSFTIVGATAKDQKVALRPVDPLESYDFAISERAIEFLNARAIQVNRKAQNYALLSDVSQIVRDNLIGNAAASHVHDALDASRSTMNHVLFIELRDINLNASFHQILGNEGMDQVPNTRIQTPNQYAIGLDGKLATGYDGPWVRFGLFGTSQFFRTTQLDSKGLETIQESRDRLLLEGESRFKSAAFFSKHPLWLPSPNMRLSYETEWTPNVSAADPDETLPRRSELRGLAGFGMTPKPWMRDLRLGLLIEKDFATTEQAGSLEWGAEAAWSGQWPVGKLRFELDGFVRGYAPQPEFDTPDDTLVTAQTIARVKMPVFLGLNLSLFADSLILMGKTENTRGPATSVIIGVTVGYGKRLKWHPVGVY